MFYAGIDMLFSILFSILFLVVLGMILYTIIGNISTWNKNNHSPRLTVPAKGESSPAKIRIRLDLPIPLEPASCSAVPLSSANDSRANSSRSPRRQARSAAESRQVPIGCGR